MDIYGYATLAGLVGLVGMALLGLSHGHEAAHPGHAHGGHGHSSHGHEAAGHGGHDHQGFGQLVIALASPRVLFSLVLGFGVVGRVAAGLLPPVLALAVAVAGGVVFERFVVSPYWRLLFAFASRPAATLESAVQGTATAVTDFNRDGSGLVALELDGQVRQVLGTLTPEERKGGLRVARGERLRVESVSARGSCEVSKLG